MTATTLNIADNRSTSRPVRWYGCTDTSPPALAYTAPSRSRNGGAGSVSASRNTSTSERAACAPHHIAHALPVQSLGRTVSPAPTVTTRAPTPRATSAVPSVDSSSTTSTSVAGHVCTASAARRAGSVPASSRAGITTEIAGGAPPPPSGGSAGTRAHRYQPAHHAAPTSTNVSSTRPANPARGAGGCSPVGSAAYGFRAVSPHDRDPRTTPGVRRRAARARRGALRRAGRGLGRPALPAAGDGGAQGRGAQARPLEPLHARSASTAPGSRTSTTRRCAR